MKFDRDALIWMPAGAVGGFAMITALSVGPLTWPVLAALIISATWRTGGRGFYGFLVGAGLMIAGVCLPQPDFRALGLIGLAVVAVGVLACFASHWGTTRTR